MNITDKTAVELDNQLPFRATGKPKIRSMTGIDLAHVSTSNCAMRIRLFLEEKGIAWNNCYGDFRNQENLTPDYFAIHPQGLVPAIVHDGVIVYESADILEYLEAKFPEPSMIPADAAAQAEMERLLEFTRSGHIPVIKTWVYGRNKKPTKTPESMAKYRELQKDQTLIDFHTETLSEGFIPDAKIRKAEDTLLSMFADLDRKLSNSEWILGDQMTLADIAWIPQYSLLQRNDFPFDRFANFMAWVARWKTRPSYHEAIVKYMPSAA